ncbi:hypothetical protein NXS19_007928 [Fusarium pseudograminearum]|nr:hypothetical protein NXS19_007928 [Fusarium pseudograminearum]
MDQEHRDLNISHLASNKTEPSAYQAEFMAERDSVALLASRRTGRPVRSPLLYVRLGNSSSLEQLERTQCVFVTQSCEILPEILISNIVDMDIEDQSGLEFSPIEDLVAWTMISIYRANTQR